MVDIEIHTDAPPNRSRTHNVVVIYFGESNHSKVSEVVQNGFRPSTVGAGEIFTPRILLTARPSNRGRGGGAPSKKQDPDQSQPCAYESSPSS